MAIGVPKIKKIKIEVGHPRGVCDFCLKKGKSYRLISNYRKYRCQAFSVRGNAGSS